MTAISLDVVRRADHDPCVATSAFRELFATDMADFYRLAFLIVANSTKAEQCLFAAMNDCVAGNLVAEAWMRTWARRAVVRNAIRIVREAQVEHSEAQQPAALRVDLKSEEASPSVFGEFSAVLGLPDFERIVFVLCTLEQYSIQDCAFLVGRLPQEVREAKVRAFTLSAQRPI